MGPAVRSFGLRALRSGLQHRRRRALWNLRRIVNRYNHEVNGYFLCDRGRFGYEFVNSPKRILQPVLDGTPFPRQSPPARE
jgi:anaerobic selenocysteine-containing dehydrogenase